MISNYLKIAFRSLWKNKGIAAINIIGLSLGLACFSLFLLHVVDEYSFERMHEKADRIYRVYTHEQEGLAGNPESKNPYLPMPLGPAMQADFPDVVRYTRYRGYGESFVRTAKGVSSERVEFADTAFFSIFSFPILYGDRVKALSAPGNVVLSEKMAQRLFGESNPLGKTLEIKLEEQFESFTVSAVAKDLPSNSTCQFDILLPFLKFAATANGKRSENYWRRSSMQTFVELRPGSGLATDAAIPAEIFPR
jgi:putative ABC transport system permease protein